MYKTTKGSWFEVVGIDTLNPELNVLTPDQAKTIIKTADPNKYCEMYPDEVEEA